MASESALWFELDDALEFYAKGDAIRGTLYLEGPGPIGVDDVAVDLCCEECMYEWHKGSQVDSAVSAPLLHRRLTVEVVLEPDPIEEPKPERASFRFRTQIPTDPALPSSFQLLGSQSKIFWFLDGFIRPDRMRPRQSRSSDVTHAHEVLEVVTPNSLAPSAGRITRASTDAALVLYPKSRRGLRRLISSEPKSSAEVRLSISYPDTGLLQHPSPLRVAIEVSSSADDLLLLKHASLSLKRMVTVKLAEGWKSSSDEKICSLWTSGELTLPLKEGIETFNKQLQHSTVKGMLDESFSSHFFEVRYELGAEVTVYYRKAPSRPHSVSLRQPVAIHSAAVGCSVTSKRNELPDRLPAYSAHTSLAENAASAETPYGA